MKAKKNYVNKNARVSATNYKPLQLEKAIENTIYGISICNAYVLILIQKWDIGKWKYFKI